MNNENYRTPLTSVETEVVKKGSSGKAIFIGFLVDIGGTALFSTIAGLVYGLSLAAQNLEQKEIENLLANIDVYSPFGIVCSLAGLLFSFLGGYVCASKSPCKEYRDASILAIFSAISGFLMGGSYYSPIENIIMAVIASTVILLGAHLHVRKSNNS